MDKMQKEKLKRALRWKACADALGSPFEFQRRPKKGDLHALINSAVPLMITDDTQMTLFGFEALLSGMGHPLQDLQEGYLCWYETQFSSFEDCGRAEGLMAFKEMYSIQEPGSTCLESMKAIKYRRKVDNNSKGCGTVMRTLPFVMFQDSGCAQMAASITHKHPEIVEVTKDQHRYMRELLLGGDPPQRRKGIPLSKVFGDGGWTALSCWEIAVWAFENCGGSWEKMLEDSILHPGDSDSTAAVAGALYGLKYEVEPPMFSRVVEQAPIKYVEKLIDLYG